MLSTSFRNTLIASTLLVGASILTGTAALAADPAPVVTDPGTVEGTIAGVSEMTFDAPVSAALAAGTFQMGTLDIHNNDPQGWTLDVASGNGGRLVHETNSAAFVTYTQLTVDGTNLGATPATLDLTPTTKTGQLVNAPYSSGVAAGVTDVAVSATMGTVDSGLPSGAYTDTLTFTLTCK